MDLERNILLIWLFFNIIDQISESIDVKKYSIGIFLNLSKSQNLGVIRRVARVLPSEVLDSLYR